MVTEDSKSVKNVDTAGGKGYEAGEKISGVKLRLGVDAGGPPHAMKVTKAGASERDGAVEVSR
ncbi:MAG: IS5/IS1182 family transposase, partial [Treponema sp.]|nr:IS5/IS1182 family transposase [Treponema sp.]